MAFLLPKATGFPLRGKTSGNLPLKDFPCFALGMVFFLGMLSPLFNSVLASAFRFLLPFGYRFLGDLESFLRGGGLHNTFPTVV